MDWWIIFHLTLILLGIAVPFVPSFAPGLIKMKWFANQRSRLLTGLLLVCLGGFTVSAHTLWFHNKFHELGSSGIGCAAFGVFDCASVIANSKYNSDPIFGAPWGVVGMLAFTLLGWLALTVQSEPTVKWVEMHLKVGVGASAIGMLIALYLVYVEIFPLGGVFCQYCSVAHFADLVSLVMFFQLLRLKEGNSWLTESEGAKVEKSKQIEEIKTERRTSGGYVKPTTSSEEE